MAEKGILSSSDTAPVQLQMLMFVRFYSVNNLFDQNNIIKQRNREQGEGKVVPFSGM